MVLQEKLQLLRKENGYSQQQLADKLGKLDYIRERTLTCYNGIQGDGCGHCPACTLRNRGLQEYLLIRN